MKQLRTSLDFRRICVASDLCFGVAGGFSFHKASEEQRNRPEKSLQTAYSGKFQKLLTNCYKYIHNIMIKAWYHVYIACILQYIILHSSENSQIDSKNVELGAVVPYNLYMATLSCQVYWGSPILHRFLLASSINSYQFANCFHVSEICTNWIISFRFTQSHTSLSSWSLEAPAARSSLTMSKRPWYLGANVTLMSFFTNVTWMSPKCHNMSRLFRSQQKSTWNPLNFNYDLKTSCHVLIRWVHHCITRGSPRSAQQRSDAITVACHIGMRRKMQQVGQGDEVIHPAGLSVQYVETR